MSLVGIFSFSAYHYVIHLLIAGFIYYAWRASYLNVAVTLEYVNLYFPENHSGDSTTK